MTPGEFEQEFGVALEEFRRHFRSYGDAEALRVLGLRDEVHPANVSAYLADSREWVDLSARANLETYGHPSFEPREIEGGWLHVLDLRPAIRKAGLTPTDASLPDETV